MIKVKQFAINLPACKLLFDPGDNTIAERTYRITAPNLYEK